MRLLLQIIYAIFLWIWFIAITVYMFPQATILGIRVMSFTAFVISWGIAKKLSE